MLEVMISRHSLSDSNQIICSVLMCARNPDFDFYRNHNDIKNCPISARDSSGFSTLNCMEVMCIPRLISV